jgi:hypothetical protein
MVRGHRSPGAAARRRPSAAARRAERVDRELETRLVLGGIESPKPSVQVSRHGDGLSLPCHLHTPRAIAQMRQAESARDCR